MFEPMLLTGGTTVVTSTDWEPLLTALGNQISVSSVVAVLSSVAAAAFVIM